MIRKINPAKIVRDLAGNKTVFNDRRSNGGRSIKVWGWDNQRYQTAIQALAEQGISARLVVTPVFKNLTWQPGGNIRIHTDPV